MARPRKTPEQTAEDRGRVLRYLLEHRDPETGRIPTQGQIAEGLGKSPRWVRGHWPVALGPDGDADAEPDAVTLTRTTDRPALVVRWEELPDGSRRTWIERHPDPDARMVEHVRYVHVDRDTLERQAVDSCKADGLSKWATARALGLTVDRVRYLWRDT